MPYRREKTVEVTRGEATVRWAGQVTVGEYEITGNPLQLRQRDKMRLVFFATPDETQALFREREAYISLDGRSYRFEALAHTAGEGRVWADISVG